MKRLVGIIQFMTRIPIPIDTGFDEAFHKGMIYFPVVGLILGVFYYGIAVVGGAIFNHYLAVIMVLIGEVILTGGLHLDGVGDTFDGLYSYRDKDRILEIMKDSRLGTNGLLAIMLLLMLKAGFIYELFESHRIWLLIIMPIAARTMQVFACYKTKTPREKGMGNIFIGKISLCRLLATYGLAAIIGAGISIFFRGMDFKTLAVLGVSMVSLTLLNKAFIISVYKKIEGVTGDILGCICEMAELEFLVIMYLVMKFF